MAGVAINRLMLTYLTIGVAVMVREGPWLGVLYVALIIAGFLAVAYSRRAKCPCRYHCSTHLWLGGLARLLPEREPGGYAFWDQVGEFMYIAGLHATTQHWLWRHKTLFALFWH